MTKVLVTGGAGTLGHHVVTRLVEMGYTARIMSRGHRPAELLPGMEWVQANLETGRGIVEAVDDIDMIVHTATNLGRAQQVDVDGTRLLMQKAREAGVAHVVYISIVGVDRIPFPYYKNKLAVEEMIEQSGIPWSILRATQFHYLVDLLLRGMTMFPLVTIVPTDFKGQTIDVSEVAAHLCSAVAAGPSGRLPDLGGPEVLTLGEMAQTWLKQRGMRRVMLPFRVPGKVAQGFRHGYNTCPEEPTRGSITWSEWLQRRYGVVTKRVAKNVVSSERGDHASDI